MFPFLIAKDKFQITRIVRTKIEVRMIKAYDLDLKR